MPRYEITGNWSGYRPSQQRAVHREYTTNEEFANKVGSLGVIVFTDNTVLWLKVRKMRPYERKQPLMLGYRTLIRDCIHYGVKSVSELIAAREEKENG